MFESWEYTLFICQLERVVTTFISALHPNVVKIFDSQSNFKGTSVFFASMGDSWKGAHKMPPQLKLSRQDKAHQALLTRGYIQPQQQGTVLCSSIIFYRSQQICPSSSVSSTEAYFQNISIVRGLICPQQERLEQLKFHLCITTRYVYMYTTSYCLAIGYQIILKSEPYISTSYYVVH